MEEKLDEISKLLRHILALELYKSGMTQEAIGKHLKIATGSVNALLKGVKKGDFINGEQAKSKINRENKQKNK